MGNQKGKDRTPGGGKEFYETDPEFFACCDHEFQFGLDAAADDNNKKCGAYLTKTDNAISVNWISFARQCTKSGVNIWLNPPYSRGLINEFLRKCWEESQAGATVVALVHTCTDTKYWGEWVWGKAAEVRHIQGRLRFWLDIQGNTSDLPHSLLVYRPRYLGQTHQISWNWKTDYIKRLGPLPIRDKNTREIIKYLDEAPKWEDCSSELKQP